MREFASPPGFEVPSTGNLTDDVVRNATEHPEAAVFGVRGDGGWQDVTARDFARQVTALAKGLVASGIAPGDRVGLMSRTRYEWTLFDYAIWFAGAVSVPVYETSSAEQVGWILSDSGARAVMVETPAHSDRVAASGTCPAELVWCLEEGAVDGLVAAGVSVPDEEIDARRSALGPASLATVVYTSGTTSPPKGCMLSHGNFMYELGVATEELDELFGPDASTLLFLPLAHVFARIVAIGAVRARVRLGFAPGVRDLVEDLSTFRPTFVLAVPRVFEKLFTTASQRAAAAGRGRTFDRATEVAIAHSRAVQDGRVGQVLRLRHRVYDRAVYTRLRAALGGRCAYAVSGGAPLGERLGHFYRGIGVTVLEGYGLTETTGAVTVNRPDAIKVGTVGRPLGGSAVRVAEDGELQVRGRQVFGGYWDNEDATRAVLDEEWLRTGDLGEIDDEGFLRVTGRKKEILVTAGGKNVAPTLLEDRIRAHPLVSQCMVVGDGRPFIAALVTLDAEAVQVWAGQRGKEAGLDALSVDVDVLAEVQGAVDVANRAVSQAEAVRRFSILPGDWTEEGGQLTPSLKLRRQTVMLEFRQAVEDLYSR